MGKRTWTKSVIYTFYNYIGVEEVALEEEEEEDSDSKVEIEEKEETLASLMIMINTMTEEEKEEDLIEEEDKYIGFITTLLMISFLF